MAWISWSQKRATRRTTTTRRKPLRRSLKNLRWRRMYLLLRADQRLKQNHEDISASSSTRTVPIGERSWTEKEAEDYSSIDYLVFKQLSTLLRHGNFLREDDGAIEFWRLKEYLWNHFEQSQHWCDEKWKSTMARSGGNKKKSILYSSTRTRNSVSLSTSRSFRTQSYWSLLVDKVFIPDNFFEHI